MSERTPPFKHLLVVHLGSVCPGVSALPGNFLLDATPDIGGDVSLQAVNLMFLMTFVIASLVVAFQRSHS